MSDRKVARSIIRSWSTPAIVLHVARMIAAWRLNDEALPQVKAANAALANSYDFDHDCPLKSGAPDPRFHSASLSPPSRKPGLVGWPSHHNFQDALRASGLRALPNNVRYLGQSGEYMLTESFTARDPNRSLDLDNDEVPGGSAVVCSAGVHVFLDADLTLIDGVAS